VRKVVINLKSRQDRRVEMEAQLSRVGWHAEFFSAIRPQDAGGFPSIGARGCFLSHLSILRQAKDDGVETLIIMEDDLNFVKDFSPLWTVAYQELIRADRPWSMFYPAHNFSSVGEGLVQLPSQTGVQCTHFIVFNGRALHAIVRELEAILSRPPGHPEGGPMHVDGAYSTVRAKNAEILTFGYTPALGKQRPSRTDVGDQKFFDKIEFLRPMVRILRKLKGQAWKA
jgi:glycosyl transferase family 25